ncbi:MAG: hypothetical protein ACOVT5_10950, partial [Armatimonadaceae bacterium]
MRNRISTVAAAVALLGPTTVAIADDVKVSGGFELGHTYNFNKPGTRTNRYLFNGRDADFSVNRSEFSISQEPSAKSNAGFVLRFIDGNVATALTGLTGTTVPNVEA